MIFLFKSFFCCLLTYMSFKRMSKQNYIYKSSKNNKLLSSTKKGASHMHLSKSLQESI